MKNDRKVRMLKFSSLPGFAVSAAPFLHNRIPLVSWSHRAVSIKFQLSLHDEVPVLFLPTNLLPSHTTAAGNNAGACTHILGVKRDVTLPGQSSS